MAAPTVAPSRWVRYLVLLRHELRRAAKTLMPRLSFALMPIVLIAFLQRTFDVAMVMSGSYDAGVEQVVPGMAVLFAFVILVYFGYSAFDDFGFGMWDRLRVARVGSLESLAAKATTMFVHLALHFAIVIAAGVVLFDLDAGTHVPELVVLFVATAAMCVAWAFMAFSLSRSNAMYNAWCYVGALALSALGGGLIPLDILPSWARTIAPATPVYWVLDGCRKLSNGSGQSARHALALLGFALLFTLVGLSRFDPNDDREAFSW